MGVARRQGQGHQAAERMGTDDRRFRNTEGVEATDDGVGMVIGGIAGCGALGPSETEQVGDDDSAQGGEPIVGSPPVPARAAETVEEQERPTARAQRANVQPTGLQLLAAAGSPFDRRPSNASPPGRGRPGYR